jgi:hypothetical protein
MTVFTARSVKLSNTWEAVAEAEQSFGEGSSPSDATVVGVNLDAREEEGGEIEVTAVGGRDGGEVS